MVLGPGETLVFSFSPRRRAHFQSFRPSRLLSDFYHVLVTFCIFFQRFLAPNLSKNRSKKQQKKKLQFLNRFFIDFDQIWAPFWSQVGPSWRYVGLLGASWGSPWRSWAPSWLQDAPKAPPEPLRLLPDLNFHRFCDHFWKDFNIFHSFCLFFLIDFSSFKSSRAML